MVKKDFTCFKCDRLEILKGCPDKVRNFSYSGCKNLISLEGGPEIVTGDFDCNGCISLESLEGCPEEVGKCFTCSGCENLKSLKGCPKKIEDLFSCHGCQQITSLEGCPEEVGGMFNCYYIGYEPSKQEIRSKCNVKGKIVGNGIL